MSSADSTDRKRVEIAVAVVEDQGRFLIGLREAHVPLAGYWEFPGGKVEPGETPERAAVRECREECGCTVRIVGRYPNVVHDYEHARLTLHFFACTLDEPCATLAPRFRWVERSQLRGYQFPPANAALIELLSTNDSR